MGGFKYGGHTELLAKYSGAKTSRLMLVANNLKVVHATAHVAFRDVSSVLSKPGRLETTIDMLHDFMIELGYVDRCYLVSS
jgi:4-hydroxythreonine-4-phosphate dehydrogenase